ncbi:TIGR04063 family PEP-CTERM/XrtA system glycosyltransferase [Glaciecola sp. 2405UD65-10]|uniref:TIGR04063 family PEP-CTERM/XrtA system glycosyltransferase n=1 Tax=Glaciecola sp. 2405UD65-10 TaxID=3397244 RepID=UPI003B5CE921
MKILHVLDHSIPLHSGYTFRTRSILNHQRELGWDTCHATSPKQGKTASDIDEVDGLVFYRSEEVSGFGANLPGLREYKIIQQLEKNIERVVKLEKPDVIHAHSPALNGIAAKRVAKAHNIPFVYEIRAFWEDAAVDHGTCKEGDLRYKLTRGMENKVIKDADAVFTICEGLRQDLLSRGIAESKITVIPNAVNISQFSLISHKNEPLLNELGLAGKTVLGFLGSFYAYEGLDVLIDALSLLQHSHPDIHLLLVGGGPEDDKLKASVERLNLGDKVTFTGRVPHSDVKNYYSLVDYLVYPRKNMRLTDLVTPLKPLEAMAQGKVVIASDVGGHKELIKDKHSGYLFAADSPESLKNKVIEILSAGTQEKQFIIDNGLKYVADERNWANSVANYKSVYANVIA